MRHIGMLALLAATGCATTPAANPRAEGPARNRTVDRSASVHVLGVPPGQLPRVGQCRVWVRGLPPGRQARSRSCSGIVATAPPGAMILYRPSRRQVRVRYLHESRAGVIVIVRMFDEGGNFIREEQPSHSDRDEDDDDRGRGRGRDRP